MTSFRVKPFTSKKKAAPHDNYGVYHEGRLVATISIRRSSSKDIGHDFIPKELNVSTNFAKQLGIYTKSRDDYLEQLGLITPPQAP